MNKKSSLRESFGAVTDNASPQPKTSSKTTGGNRADKVALTTWIDPAGKTELKILGAEKGRTQDDLMREAINDLLKRYGKKPLA